MRRLVQGGAHLLEFSFWTLDRAPRRNLSTARRAASRRPGSEGRPVARLSSIARVIERWSRLLEIVQQPGNPVHGDVHVRPRLILGRVVPHGGSCPAMRGHTARPSTHCSAIGMRNSESGQAGYVSFPRCASATANRPHPGCHTTHADARRGFAATTRRTDCKRTPRGRSARSPRGTFRIDVRKFTAAPYSNSSRARTAGDLFARLRSNTRRRCARPCLRCIAGSRLAATARVLPE